ncbi:MAG: GNAT family N-acetyltransferase, partial [Novosphingobium sp.]
WRGRPGFRLAVCLPDGALIGTVGIGPEAPPSCAYFIDPAPAGQGFATEAMQALLADAIPRFAFTEIEADHFADNPASGRVLRKAGFRPTGQILQRFSLARGTEVASIEHELDLVEPCRCDDDPSLMRAA